MRENNREFAKERRFTEAETANLLGVSKMTIRRKREAGELKYYKIGSRIIISEGQIAEFLDLNEQNKSEMNNGG
jgi:excisionase family DNA binding protein